MKLKIILSSLLSFKLAIAQFEFPNFTGADNLLIVGDSSSRNSNVIRLMSMQPNQAGRAFFQDALTLNDQSFSTFFQFVMNEATSGGDGFAFIILSEASEDSITNIEAPGGLGYNGLGSSLGIEFEPFGNVPTPHITSIQVTKDWAEFTVANTLNGVLYQFYGSEDLENLDLLAVTGSSFTGSGGERFVQVRREAETQTKLVLSRQKSHNICRFRTTRIVGINFGVGDGAFRISNKTRRHREFPIIRAIAFPDLNTKTFVDGL